MSDASTHPLLRLAAAPDDRDAWSAAVAAYASLCWRIALRMLGGEDQASDAVQDTLLALRASARRFRPAGDLDASAIAWVARVAVNTCHTHRRRRRLGGQPDVNLEAPADVAADAESLQAVRTAVVELPARLREAIELRFFAELDGPRLAEALGVAPGAARMRVHRGLDTLRAILVRRGVSLSAVALLGLLHGVAEAAGPPLPPDAVSIWSRMPLPGLTTATITTGGILVMSVIAGTILTLAVFAASSEQGPPPAPRPASSPAPAVVPQIVGSFADVKTALAWLAAQQQPDGSWLPGQAVVPAMDRNAPTASALIAILGGGYSVTRASAYQGTLQRGVAWLLEHPPAVTASIRTLALHALALSENQFGLGPEGWPGVFETPEPVDARQERLKCLAATEAAVAVLLGRRVGSGWPAKPGDPHIDAWATAWGAMALKSADFSRISGAAPARELVRVWTDRTWSQRTGQGFPACTTIDAVPVGTLTADIPALLAVAYTRKTMSITSTEASTWSELIARVAAAPPQKAADAAWMQRMGAWWAEGEAWKACHAARLNMNTQASMLALAGDLEDAAVVILAMEAHERWEQFFGKNAPAKINVGIDARMDGEPPAPQATY